jgi:hypothetical protein
VYASLKADRVIIAVTDCGPYEGNNTPGGNQSLKRDEWWPEVDHGINWMVTAYGWMISGE